MKVLPNRLSKTRISRNGVLILGGALIGAALFFLINTGASLDVTNDSWILGGYVERDIIQHHTGWLFFRQSPFIFPFGVSNQIGIPAGVTIAFSDSIPVMAFLFRLLAPILPETFQYFGIYVLLCYMLMGVSSALLLGLFNDGILPVLIGSILFVVNPIFIERCFRHTALASQFLILFALFLYFKNRKEGFRFRVAYLILSAACVLTHFYFVPMVMSILLADLLQDAIKNKGWLKKIGFLLLNFAVIIAIAASIGYFHTPNNQSGVPGYGLFCMNLNTLINPLSLSGIVWSRFLPVLDQWIWSFDGFNYLGLGVLLTLAIAAGYYVFGRKLKVLKSMVSRNVALLGVSIFLTLFAISTTVTINENVYLRLQLPALLQNTLSLFRSSGRIFWPVNYLLLLFSVNFIFKTCKKYWKTVLVSALVVIQIIDISPALVTKHRYFSDNLAPIETTLKSDFWEDHLGAFDCVFTFSQEGCMQGLYLANYAARGNATTNEPFLARNDMSLYYSQGDAEYERMLSGEIDKKTLYIFNDMGAFVRLAEVLDDDIYAARIDYFYFIVTHRDNLKYIPTHDDNAYLYNEILLHLADYSQDGWLNGVNQEDKSLVLFEATDENELVLSYTTHLGFSGNYYEVLSFERSGEWLVVRLATDDANALVGQDLCIRR